ncbi:MAG: nuclease of the RecB family [Clostridiaceae bacterium]|jgi:hypothetical protein|nr:nuclease of the RecB family [Clostridiaceae bacterium]
MIRNSVINLNYESELSDVLLKNLLKLYNLKNEEVLYHYFYLRFLIENNEKKIDDWNKNKLLIDFLISELNLPIYNNFLIYKGQRFSRAFSVQRNTLDNIVTDWQFRGTLHKIVNSKGIYISFEKHIKKEWDEINAYGKNKAKLYKSTIYYQSCFKKNSLDLLNDKYNVKTGNIPVIKYIKYPETHNYFIRTLEERYLSEVKSAEFITNNVSNITEADVENFLISNLNLLEEGLKYVDKQCVVKGGRIDIVAKDINNSVVLIELKLHLRKEILWQCLRYPKAYMDINNVDKVRMLAVTPKLPEHILQPLIEAGIEVMQYKPLVEMGKIKNLIFEKRN